MLGILSSALMAADATPTPVGDGPLTPFAIGCSAIRTRDAPTWMPKMTAIGLTDMRAVGGWWGGLEKEPGVWNWAGFDERLAAITTLGATTGLTLIGTPAWSPGGNRGLPLQNLAGWSAYVREVVTHTKGRIQRFEVWNEPPNGTANATGADYAKLVVASYDAAKAADPAAQVGIAAKSAHINYLDQAIAAGAKGHYDYITLHPYEVLSTVVAHPGTEAIYMSIAPNVRKMLMARDPERVSAPIIFTELGYNAKKGEDKQVQAVVKAYVMGIAQGIASIHWFEGMDGDSGTLGLMDGKGRPRPAYNALKVLIEQLGRHPTYIGWVLLNERHYGFVFQGVQAPVMATWTATSAPDTVDFGQGVHLIDPPTGAITEATTCKLTINPVLVTGLPAALVALAKENRGKPFPWGGDYSAATSVSVTMGEQNVEKGLHTMSADTIAADVVTYGGNARAGNVPGGNVYLVDPNFLSYTAMPIEITAVVRRNAKNTPVKLALEYESVDGYSKPAPIEIPEGTEWHPVTWHIEDPRFVGCWAFHFRLNSGDYGIQSMTVTKVGKANGK